MMIKDTIKNDEIELAGKVQNKFVPLAVECLVYSVLSRISNIRTACQ
jgi:hypothetical protein